MGVADATSGLHFRAGLRRSLHLRSTQESGPLRLLWGSPTVDAVETRPGASEEMEGDDLPAEPSL